MIAPCDKAPKPIRYAMLAAFVLAWVGAFVATHLPPEDVSDIHISDKVAHFICYGVLATLLAGTLTFFGRKRLFRVVLPLGILLAYGAFDELTQPAFSRFASFDDWLADAAGVVMALACWETILVLFAAFRRRGREA